LGSLESKTVIGRVEIYIETKDAELNKRNFDYLYAHKDAIEQEYSYFCMSNPQKQTHYGRKWEKAASVS
jgi:hypothetical protein